MSSLGLKNCLFELKLKESSKDKLNFQGKVRITVKPSLTVTIMSNASLVSTRDLNPGRQHDEQAPPPPPHKHTLQDNRF